MAQISRDGKHGLQGACALLQLVLGLQFTSIEYVLSLLDSGDAETVTGVLDSQTMCDVFQHVHERHTKSYSEVISSSHIILDLRLIAILPALSVALTMGKVAYDYVANITRRSFVFVSSSVMSLFKILEAVATVQTHNSWTLLISV